MIFDEIDTRMGTGNLDVHDIKSGMSTEKIAQYLSAGILLPEEVLIAEKIVRRSKIQ